MSLMEGALTRGAMSMHYMVLTLTLDDKNNNNKLVLFNTTM